MNFRGFSSQEVFAICSALAGAITGAENLMKHDSSKEVQVLLHSSLTALGKVMATQPEEERAVVMQSLHELGISCELYEDPNVSIASGAAPFGVTTH